MNINHHNYEEYFILYMDNELNSGGRRMVETFVQNNPDLKEELDALLQSRLAPDSNIVFEGKDELMRMIDGASINANNYEEWLVLYIDNELSPGQKASVEKFIAQDPAAKTEFGILNKTRLQPEEEIVFPNKELLYRRTEKVRVIQMRWWRVAAAAIFIFAVGITVLVILNNKKSSVTNNGLATTPKQEQKTSTENPVVINKETKDQATQLPLTETVKPTTNPVSVKHNNVAANEKNPDNLPVKVNKNDQGIADNNEKPSNHLPQPIDNRTINALDKSIAGNEKLPVINLTNPNEIKTNGAVTTTTTPTSDNQKENTSVTKIEDNGLMYASEKKNSLRGFFRKVARTFEKRTKINPADEDGRVMIAGLAVNLK